MRPTNIILSAIAITALLLSWTANSDAYTNFSTCQSCHALFDHDAHSAAAGGNCGTCHGGFPPALSNCTQCHNGAGLRNHHRNSGAHPCNGCHSTAETAPPEDTMPAGYAGTALDPCDGSEEGFASNTVSLDNDGDLLTDGDDPDCQVADLCAGIVCDDGDTCNGMESCDPVDGSCIPGNPVTCDDSNPCTDDACDPANGACFSAPVVCPAGETCDPATGTCVADDLCQNVVCDDGDACNGLETCDPATGACLPGTAIVCDDGNLCNGMETCDSASGNCNPGQDLCPPDQQCDPQTGACMAGGTNHSQTTCLGCHGDLSAGATCATADRHVPGRVSQQVWDETLGELGLNCDTTPPDGGTPPSSGLPADHTDKEDGALHKPGKERPFTNNCTMCHGSDLRGNMGPSCYTCHGREWDEREPNDGGTGAPADHTDREDGAMHKPGKNRPYSNSCTSCHGADLTGGFGPSCYTCHGREWDERGPGMDRHHDDDDSDDDSSDDDDRRRYRR